MEEYPLQTHIMGLALVGLVQPQLPYDFLVGQQFSVLRESDSGFWIDNGVIHAPNQDEGSDSAATGLTRCIDLQDDGLGPCARRASVILDLVDRWDR
ncbi:hypothetical protein OOU_Y34scaffold00744g1 [Pyricularia oryzae Y34]|uniref:Uncharacterized protein n=2 Tax=Pyricularia oryzae TaxID=318829 RepID=A0AA97PHK5_PYRO3|nr:hypothetical protein OOU_Y34scaffold00744g1 [Pyricularia oryzae Y34]